MIEEDPSLLTRIKDTVVDLDRLYREELDYITKHDPDAIAHPYKWMGSHIVAPLFMGSLPDLTPTQWVRLLKLTFNREKTLRDYKLGLENKQGVNRVLNTVETLTDLYERILKIDQENDEVINDIKDDIEACCRGTNTRFDSVDGDLSMIEEGVDTLNVKVDLLDPVTQANNSLETLTNTKIIMAKLNKLGRFL